MFFLDFVSIEKYSIPPRKDGRSGTQNFKVPSVLISTNFTTPSVLISTNITKSVHTVILIFFSCLSVMFCYVTYKAYCISCIRANPLPSFDRLLRKDGALVVFNISKFSRFARKKGWRRLKLALIELITV